MTMNWIEANDIYSYEFDNHIILYSPIARKYVVADKSDIDDFINNGKYGEVFSPLADYVPIEQQNRVRTPADYTLLTVLPNNTCNFTCTYCYSAVGRNCSVLDISKLETAIDYFICSKPESFSKPLTVSFMGGGEPFLSWKIVKEGILYAKEKAACKNLKINLKIITNGSILDEEKIRFIKKQGVEISVSFEIIERIQNNQRKHYNLVRDNIAKLISAGIPVQINSTITPANAHLMEDMMNILVKDFPEIRNAMFEPVTAKEMFSSPIELRKFYNTYIDGFIKARTIGDMHDVELTSFAYLRTIFPLMRACPGEYCITADGDITGCYCVATKNEKLFAKTVYGTIDNGVISFDIDRFNTLIGNDIHSKEKCNDCKVKWNCGGGCFHLFNTYPEEYTEEACEFTKKFVEAVVKYKVRTQFESYNAVELPVLLSEKI